MIGIGREKVEMGEDKGGMGISGDIREEDKDGKM